jgi:ssDNA-binding Zn-finger/Zn-ribbon topoisomerase 1
MGLKCPVCGSELKFYKLYKSWENIPIIEVDEDAVHKLEEFHEIDGKFYQCDYSLADETDSEWIEDVLECVNYEDCNFVFKGNVFDFLKQKKEKGIFSTSGEPVSKEKVKHLFTNMLLNSTNRNKNGESNESQK